MKKVKRAEKRNKIPNKDLLDIGKAAKLAGMTYGQYVAKMGLQGVLCMKKLYQTNKDFKEYVDRYMRNRDVTLEEVLSYKQTQLVGEMYKEQAEEMKNIKAKQQMGE